MNKAFNQATKPLSSTVPAYIIENSPLLIVRLTPTAETIYVNPAACLVSGYSRQQIMETGWVDLVYPGDKRQQIEDLKDTFEANRDVQNYELTITTRDGRDRIIRWHSVNLFDDDGRVVEWIGLGRDITEGRAKKIEAQRTAERLAEAQRVANIGSWELVPLTGELWWSEQCFRIFDVAPQSVSHLNYENFLATVLPEDRVIVTDTYTRSLETNTINEMKYRLVTSGQDIKHLHAIWSHVYGENGSVERTIGTVRDITEEVQREQKIKEIEAEARDLQTYNEHVVQNSPMFIVGLTPKGSIKHINDAGCNISGYRRDELIGRDFANLLVPGSYQQQMEGLLRQYRKYTRLRDYEMTIVTKQGEERIISWTSADRIGDAHETKEIIGFGIDVTELKHSQRELEQLVHFDSLTNLPNRFHLAVRLGLALEAAIETGNCGALIRVDLDRFKDINESANHETGDRLLQLVAKRLLACVRQHDIVARLGGDEFAILIKDLGRPININQIVKKVKHAFLEAYIVADTEFKLNASIGLSLFPRDGRTVEELFKNTDIAIRKAKDMGGDIESYYTPELKKVTTRLIRLEKDLRKALENEELTIYYQPQVSLRDGSLTGAESLLRWIHPDEGFISPAEFIPIAEATGLIIPIGDWVLRKACVQARSWYENGLDIGQIAVNIAGPQITRGNLIRSCEEALALSGLKPGALELEVTEGFIMKDAENSISTLNQLREIGIPMSIDDFGTGYSSLAYLKNLPLDTIKIDRSFIRGVPQDRDDSAITKTIISLGKNLGLDVLAEGVETVEQRDFLLQHGCEFAQGFFFYKPMPAAEFFTRFEATIHSNTVALMRENDVA